MMKILKDAFALFMITLVAGAMLAGVYAITKEPIAKAEMEKRTEAYKVVFAGAEFYEEDALKEAVKTAKEDFGNAGFAGVELQDALYVRGADGKPSGCVLTVAGKGYGGQIKIAMGVDANGKITGISILSQTETAGLGTKCEEPGFYGQFANKPAQTLTVVKDGADAPNEIDAISGATVTSRGVTDAVNAGVWFIQNKTQLGGSAE